jgi:hypothetical protein
MVRVQHSGGPLDHHALLLKENDRWSAAWVVSRHGGTLHALIWESSMVIRSEAGTGRPTRNLNQSSSAKWPDSG